ncbi:MAG: hypothetical protein Q7S06_00010 [Nanoarchaeota archaeon]|nr:hypothetical protein [Nanoarchaeota archaeon]
MEDSLAREVADLKSNLINVNFGLAHTCRGNPIVEQKRIDITARLELKEKLLLLKKQEEERQKKLEQEKIIQDFMNKPFVNLSEDKTYFTISVSGVEFLFDNEKEEIERLSVLSNIRNLDINEVGYSIFKPILLRIGSIGSLNINDGGYLCSWDYPIHTELKLIERKKLSEDLGCDLGDIHVHHIDLNQKNNRKKNLEVLHKDNHAKRHGFPSWDALQLWRAENLD